MLSFNSLPEWLGTAIIAAIFAFIGFFGRKIFDGIDARRKKKENAVQELEKLTVLLNDSKSVFKNQNYLVQRLATILQKHLTSITGGIGYDETFYHAWESMNDEELELFNLIRGTTVNSMHRLNQDMLSWANNHTAKQLLGYSSPKTEKVDTQLIALRMHLNFWFDKYESIFIKSDRRSLVYLNDEKKQGIGFPSELSQDIKELLETLG